eukprot:TRINITY_DN3780_c0_g1_i2.p1 TRINITY_DN3780_c0_g1~~TRINITY_DN3780_c0_g1_i2.p1  ORF type:complete len:516 (-),score=100.94 TRINITY_DN3780_c0_g1_i2:122-1612(-)
MATSNIVEETLPNHPGFCKNDTERVIAKFLFSNKVIVLHKNLSAFAVDPVDDWWLECLKASKILGCVEYETSLTVPGTVKCDQMLKAVQAYTGAVCDAISVAKLTRTLTKFAVFSQHVPRGSVKLLQAIYRGSRTYRLPAWDVLRAQYDTKTNTTTDWNARCTAADSADETERTEDESETDSLPPNKWDNHEMGDNQEEEGAPKADEVTEDEAEAAASDAEILLEAGNREMSDEQEERVDDNQEDEGACKADIPTTANRQSKWKRGADEILKDGRQGKRHACDQDRAAADSFADEEEAVGDSNQGAQVANNVEVTEDAPGGVLIPCQPNTCAQDCDNVEGTEHTTDDAQDDDEDAAAGVANVQDPTNGVQSNGEDATDSVQDEEHVESAADCAQDDDEDETDGTQDDDNVEGTEDAMEDGVANVDAVSEVIGEHSNALTEENRELIARFVRGPPWDQALTGVREVVLHYWQHLYVILQMNYTTGACHKQYKKRHSM